MDHHTRTAPEGRGETAARLRLVTDQTRPGKDRAIVPSRFVRSVLRHHVDGTASLFEYRTDDDMERLCRLKPGLAARYENTWTTHELDLIFAAFQRAAETDTAAFRSHAEWIQLASGKHPDSAPEYRDAIVSLTQPHWVLDLQDDRYILSHEPPVRLAEHYIESDDLAPQRIVEVTLARSIRRNLKSFHRVPVALGQLLREGGLRRVNVAHIKLYLYVLTRVMAARPQYTLDLTKIIHATGLAGHLKQRKKGRAVNLLRDGFNALVGAKVLTSWEMLGGDHVSIKPNRYHFRDRKGLSQLAQNETGEPRLSGAIPELSGANPRVTGAQQ